MTIGVHYIPYNEYSVRLALRDALQLIVLKDYWSMYGWWLYSWSVNIAQCLRIVWFARGEDICSYLSRALILSIWDPRSGTGFLKAIVSRNIVCTHTYFGSDVAYAYFLKCMNRSPSVLRKLSSGAKCVCGMAFAYSIYHVYLIDWGYDLGLSVPIEQLYIRSWRLFIEEPHLRRELID